MKEYEIRGINPISKKVLSPKVESQINISHYCCIPSIIVLVIVFIGFIKNEGKFILVKELGNEILL